MGWLTIIIIAGAVWLLVAYNKLRRLAENVKRRQANVAATIKKRHDIAQRLADIAASYGDHEKLTHFTLAEGEANMAHASAAAADASRVIGNVQLLATRFPELKANSAYQQLMTQLDEIESNVLDRREAYNEAAQDYNAQRGSIPHLFYAGSLGFTEAPYFAVDESGGEQLASFHTDDGKILRDTMGRMATLASSHAQSAAERLKRANEARQLPDASARPDGEPSDREPPKTPPAA